MPSSAGQSRLAAGLRVSSGGRRLPAAAAIGSPCKSPRPSTLIKSPTTIRPIPASPIRRVERQGDLRAIEGTEVTLHATANTEIKPDTAEIDLGCTGRRGVRMTADGRTAVGQFTLRLNPDDPSRGQYDSYQLRFSDLQGQENLRPIRYRIEVIRDLPPDVQLVEPQAQETQVAEDGRLAIKVRAEDPDFALCGVALRAECDGRRLPLPPLLERKSDEKPWQGEFRGTYTFEPAKLGTQGRRSRAVLGRGRRQQGARGQSLRHRQAMDHGGGPRGPAPAAEVRRRPARPAQPQPGKDKAATDGRAESPDNRADNNRPNPMKASQNQTGGKPAEKPKPGKTPPSKEGQPREAGAGDSKPRSTGSESGAKGGKATRTASTEMSEHGNQQGGQPSEKPNERIDPEAAPGDAMQEILKDREKNQRSNRPTSRSPATKRARTRRCRWPAARQPTTGRTASGTARSRGARSRR